MGAGTSKSLRSYLLHGWSPQVDVPEKLETEARRLARLALRQAEVQAPHHRRHLHNSEPRPPWMDPTLLHVALAGSSQAAVDAVLAALACAAPLAEVVSEEAESGAVGQTMEIGLRCFAFLDSDLRILRLWVVLHTRDLSGTALGLSRFDLLLWVQGSPSEVEAEEMEEDDHKSVIVARNEDPLLKESISVDIDGAGIDADAGPESTLFTLSPSSVFDQDPFGPTFSFAHDASMEVTRTEEELRESMDMHTQTVQQREEQVKSERKLEDPNSFRQGTLLDNGSLRSTGPLPSFVPKPTFYGDLSSDLASEAPDALTKFGSSLPASNASNASSCTTLPPVDGDDVVDELTNALPAEECQSQAACSSLQGASVESSSGMTGGSASVESSSGLTKGTASHTSSVSDLVLQVYQEMEGGVSLERLQELNRVLAKQCIAEEKESTISEECRTGNETALAKSEDYRSGNESAMVLVDAVAKVPDGRRRKELEQALEEARAEKQRAAQAEDYDAAHEAKEREKALLAKLESFNTGGVGFNSEAAAESRRRSLEEALQRARVEKRRACEAADYDAAHEAKEREKAVLIELEGLLASSSSTMEQQRLEEQLTRAQAAKQSASAAEDYDAAYEAKELENRLLAQLELLRMEAPRNIESPMVSKGAARWSCIAAAADTNQVEHRRAQTAENARVPGALRKLAGWANGRPPLLVAGESGEVLKAVRSMLPEASVCELPGAALAEASVDGSQLMRMRGFWELLETGVRVISSSRAFSSRESRQNAKEEDFGDGLKRGSPVRLCRLNIEALKAHNGKTGIVIGMDKKGYLIRLWDDEVIQVVQNNLTPLKFKLAPPSPIMLTRMDKWLVKLKGLQSMPELNGQEGTTEPTASESGRHHVRLKDGAVIAAKDANFEVVERDRPGLEGCVGLLDGYQLEGPLKYKVLLVNPASSGRVRLKGLVQKPELNGREGSIIVFKVETQRYQVALSGDGCEVNVRRVNMDFLHPQRITARALSLCPERVDCWLDPDEEETLSVM